MWMLWFANPWSQPRQFLAIGLAWVIAAIPILPLLLRYRAIHASFGFTRDFGTIRDFGADVASVLHATPHLALWGWLEVFPARRRGAVSGTDDRAAGACRRRVRARSE